MPAGQLIDPTQQKLLPGEDRPVGRKWPLRRTLFFTTVRKTST